MDSPNGSLQKLSALTQEKITQVLYLVQVFDHESGRPHKLFEGQDLNRDFVAEAAVFQNELIKEDLKLLSTARANAEVQRDNLCRLSVVIACLGKVQEHL